MCLNILELFSDKNTFMDNFEEYADPMDYDCEYGKAEPELTFYSQIARSAENPILEIACGTGRISIPLALQGFNVTGIDLCEGMINWAKQKAGNIPVKFQVDDCRAFVLDQKFKMIFMTGNSFQALLTRADQELFLDSVQKHLSDEGIFAFDTRFPLLSELSNTSNQEEHWQQIWDYSVLAMKVP